MGEPLRVDPPALSGAGTAVAGLSEGLSAAVGALTGSYNANTGQDAAGTLSDSGIRIPPVRWSTPRVRPSTHYATSDI